MENQSVTLDGVEQVRHSFPFFMYIATDKAGESKIL